MLQEGECFSAAGTGRRSGLRETWMEQILENLIESTQDLRLGWRFALPINNDSKCTVKTTQEWFRETVSVPEWPSWRFDLNLIDHLVRDLKMSIHQHIWKTVVIGGITAGNNRNPYTSKAGTGLHFWRIIYGLLINYRLFFFIYFVMGESPL